MALARSPEVWYGAAEDRTGLDEALGFSVGARCVGARSDMAHLGPAESLAEGGASIGRAVIGHDAFRPHAVGLKEGQGS